MAELQNRGALEEQFARRMGRLNARHLRELKDKLGNPPDPTRITEEDWERWEREEREELLLLLAFLFAASATLHGMPADQAKEAGERYAIDQAAQVAAQRSETSQDIFNRRVEAWGEKQQEAYDRAQQALREHNTQVFEAEAAESAGQVGPDVPSGGPYELRGDVYTDEEIREIADRAAQEAIGTQEIREVGDAIFNPNRLATMTETEVPSAQNQGTDSARDHRDPQGVSIIAFWRHSGQRPRHHCNSPVEPCEQCSPLEGLPQEECAGNLPGQIHPRCDCFWELYDTISGEWIGHGPDVPPDLLAWADQYVLPMYLTPRFVDVD